MLIIIIAVLAANPDPKEFIGDVAKIIGVGVTALFSIATFVLTFTTDRLKLAEAHNLEETKSHYSYALEVNKRRLELESTIYQACTKAASKFYRAVEDCRFRPALSTQTMEAANTEMRDADAYSMWLPKDLGSQWYAFWQMGTNLAAELQACTTDAARDAAWKASAQDFGTLLKTFQSTFLETRSFAPRGE